MAKTIKVNIINADKTEFKEITFEQAKTLVAESYASGSTVIDKRTGYVIDDITADVDEIIIVAPVDGG
ncbi:hypothetical protein ACFLUZ_03125 [Chloroflexota bacterium]